MAISQNLYSETHTIKAAEHNTNVQQRVFIVKVQETVGAQQPPPKAAVADNKPHDVNDVSSAACCQIH